MPKHKHENNNKNEILKKLDKTRFRVSLFGSARIKSNTDEYKQIKHLAKQLGKEHIDLVTGGGFGIMEAANAGHDEGDPENKATSIGLTIHLPEEAKGNKYIELEKHFQKFSHRLDTFMAISHAVIVTPGGVGTCLELFYTMQLTQVKHIKKIPIILVGKMWERLIVWLEKYPLKSGYVNEKDLKNLHYAKNNKQAMEIVLKEFEKFKKIPESKRPQTLPMYKLD